MSRPAAIPIPQTPGIVPPTPGLGINQLPSPSPFHNRTGSSEVASEDISPFGSPSQSLDTPTASPTFAHYHRSPSLHSHHRANSFNVSGAAGSRRASAGQSAGANATPSIPTMKNPFNFQPMMMSAGPTVPKANQRRGHKYKHSSVSHNIFVEPPVRAPLALPASLPIPTWTELYKSISGEQRMRALWCCCHMAVAAYTLWSAAGSLAMTALSHSTTFDALGAAVCVAVDVLSNFEVWRRSSIRHPFGLERAEVLAGFAMSVFLLFMGFDIISHTSEHLVEGLYKDDGHGHRGDQPEHIFQARVSPGSLDFAALAALVSTTVSAVVLKNHARIGKAMRFAYLSSLPSILSNPSHFITLVSSFALLVIPLVSLPSSSFLDRTLAISMSIAMISIGICLVKALGSMLLLSYSGKGVTSVIREIALEKDVLEVTEAKFWQVHHGLCIATLKLRVRDLGDMEEGRLREKIMRLVRERLGGGYGGGGTVRWEVSVALMT